MPLHYVNPLISAFLFALASLLIKRALIEGGGATRIVFVTNGVFFIALVPLWWIFPHPFPVDLLWAPPAAGVAAFLGSLFQTLALKFGDVSVATPLLGGKVLFVALFSTLILGNLLPVTWWAGAVLAGLGVFLLGYRAGAPHMANRIGLTILLSLISVAGFALMDVIIAGWGKAFGFQRFVALQQVVTFTLSFSLVPFFQGSLGKMPRACWKWLTAGSLIVVCQYYLINWTISTYGDPTAINIMYSSRGIWSVLLVWGIGPLLGNRERHLGAGVFIRRAIGSSLLFFAILLVIFGDAFPL